MNRSADEVLCACRGRQAKDGNRVIALCQDHTKSYRLHFNKRGLPMMRRCLGCRRRFIVIHRTGKLNTFCSYPCTIKHGGKGTHMYRVWSRMKERCYRAKNDNCHVYGGRGITVCRRWRASFLDFLRDVVQPPSPKHTLDRKNTEGHYEPGNVRWATPKEQGRNKRTNHVVTINGKTRCLAEWVEIYNISRATVKGRISRGVDPAIAITTPGNTRLS